MKKVKLFVFLFLVLQSLLWSNPIDTTPVTLFSELVFDSNNKWTMELLLRQMDIYFKVDSVTIRTSGVESKLLISFQFEKDIYVITSDSLSFPVEIKREGDSIEIVTYLTSEPNHGIRQDLIVFGNFSSASVGSPTLEFSTISRIYGNIICLSNKPSLGKINDPLALSSTMKGHIYDTDGNSIAQIKFPYYFKLETLLEFNADGSYTTRIYRTFPSVVKDYLYALVQGIDALSDTARIDPIELNDVHPDTVVIQDIHLKSNRFVVTSLDENEPPRSEEFTLINYPNPFNLSTNFFVKIPDRMKGKEGIINIYNASGQIVNSISICESKTVTWDGKDKTGNVMPSGIYFYQLNFEKQMMKSGSMILLK